MAEILSFSPYQKYRRSFFKRAVTYFIGLDPFTRLFLISFFLIALATPLIVKNLQIFSPKAAAPMQTTTYEQDNSNFPNPDRGFYTTVDLNDPTSIQRAKAAGNTIVRGTALLELSSPNAQVEETFRAARQAGIKIIVRFVYNTATSGTCQDKSETDTVNNVHSLKDWIEFWANPDVNPAVNDVISSFEAGFIGCNGQWYGSSNGLDTNVAAKTHILKEILQAFPPSKKVALPSVAHIRDVWPGLTESERNRIGFYNDCFLGDDTDGGAYRNSIDDKAFIATMSAQSVVEGQTCKVSTRSTCSTALSELQQLHFSSLNEDADASVIQSFKDQGCFDTIQKNLGYRFSLLSASYSSSITAGDTFTLQASIRNDGFAAPFNYRPVFAVLYDKDNYRLENTYFFQLKTDPRTWAGGTTTNITETFTLPQEALPGTYTLALWLPDAYTAGDKNPSYAIRFANLNVWNNDLGYNDLSHNITITSSASSPFPSPTGSNPPITPEPTGTRIWLEAENGYINNPMRSAFGDGASQSRYIVTDVTNLGDSYLQSQSLQNNPALQNKPTPSALEGVTTAPNQLIVKFKDGQSPEELDAEVSRRNQLAKTQDGSEKVTAENTTLASKGEKTPEEKQEALSLADKKAHIKERSLLFGKDTSSSRKNITLIKTEAGLSAEELKATYAALPQVEYAEPNYIVSAQLTPNDAFFPMQWNFKKIQLPQAWDITVGSKQVIVAVLDSGITQNAFNYDMPPDDSVIPGPAYHEFPDTFPYDKMANTHGTLISGIISALGNNSIGISGINFDTKIMPIQVLDFRGSGYLSDVAKAIYYAADHGAKIINISFGYSGSCTADSVEQDAITYAKSKGVLVVTSAGNSNTDAKYMSPGSCDGVFNVAATGPTDQRTSYSNYGNLIDIAAPGGEGCKGSVCPTFCASYGSCDILSTSGRVFLDFFSGTSMSAAHVSGVAALMLSVNPSLTPDQIENILRTTGDIIATDKPISGRRINAFKAVQEAKRLRTTPQPELGFTVEPASVSATIRAGESKQVLTIRSSTETPYYFIGNPTTELLRKPVAIDPFYNNSFSTWHNFHENNNGYDNGIAPVEITVDSSTPPGTYTGTGILKNATNGAYITIPVSVTVLPATDYQPPFVVPTNTGSAVREFTVPKDGTYYIWARTNAPDYTRDESFWLKIDDQPAILIRSDIFRETDTNGWRWFNGDTYGSLTRLHRFLTAGTHTATIIGRDAGTLIDVLLLTDEVSYIPNENFESNLQPTPTINPLTPIPTSPPNILSSISGNVFFDLNGNHRKDPDETSRGGFTITLSGRMSQTTTVDSSGNYSFTNLPTGNYSVEISGTSGMVPTLPNPHAIILPPDAVVDFGLQFTGGPIIPTPTPFVDPTPTRPIPTNTPTPTPKPLFTISGNVFLDTNGNGSKNTGEANRIGETITISGAAIGTTSTDSSGNFSFSEPAGTYTVTLLLPNGFAATTTNPRTIILGPNTTVNFGMRAVTPTPTVTPLLIMSEVENGSLTAPMSVENDSQASNGKYISSPVNQAIAPSASSLSQNPSQTAQSKAEEIPNQIVVKYKQGEHPTDIQQEVDRRSQIAKTPIIGGTRIALENAGLRLSGKKTPEEKIEELSQIDKKARVKERKKLGLGSKDLKMKNIELLKTDTASVKELQQLYSSLPEVEYAAPNYKARAFAVPNDSRYGQQWSLTNIQADKAWDLTKGNSQTIVAVIDSGIDYTHEDLGGNGIGHQFNQKVVSGYDFVNNDNDPYDDFGHGTHVAGTIAALTDNNKGVSGVNWNTKLMAVKVLDSGGVGDFALTAQGINYAAANGAKVINLSLGGAGFCSQVPYLQDSITYARSQGTTVVVAAGNSGQDAGLDTPGNCDGVITVGAVGPTNTKAYYSNYGSTVDIAAPGGDSSICSRPSSLCEVLSTWPQNQYEILQGTSMATPHVSGVVSLMLAINPNLTPDQIETMLKASADPLNTDPNFPIGGRLNAFRAVQAASGNLPPITPIPSLTPPPVNSGALTFTVSVPTTTTYAIWSRIFAPTTNNDSYYLQIDNQPAVTVGDGEVQLNTWTWINHKEHTNNRITFALSAGNHTVRITGREAYTRIDKILLTNDLSFEPYGFGDTPRPTPTNTPVPTNTPTPTSIPTPTSTPTPTPFFSISGRVFIDANNNGIRESSEVGFSGATLTASNGLTKTTDASGIYVFSLIPAGTYTVTLTVPSGYITTTPNPRTITLGPDASVSFGIIAGTATPTPTGGQGGPSATPVPTTVPTAIPTPIPTAIPTAVPTAIPTPTPVFSITGNVFIDSNGNGVKDSGEANSTGRTLTLSGQSTGTATTDASGNYTFSNRVAGNYTVTLTVPSGFTATTTNPRSISVGPNATVNFGIVSIPTATAIPTVTQIPTTVPTVIPTVIPTTIPTIIPTIIATGTPTIIPTHIPTAIPTATTIPTVIPTNIPTNIPTQIATVIPTATTVPTAIPTPTPVFSITGNVFIDSNGNGVKDSGEANSTGRTVTLTIGQAGTSTTTNTSGNYTFNTLPSGNYTVTLTVPSGFTSTTVNPVPVVLGPNATVNFGIVSIPTATAIPTATVVPTTIPTTIPTAAPTPTRVPTTVPTATTIPTAVPTPTTIPTQIATTVPTAVPTVPQFFSITGNVYDDANNNGAKDAEDSPVAGATLVLTGEVNKSVRTNADGLYSIDNLAAGNYVITIISQSGYRVTTTNPRIVILGPTATVNFGLFPLPLLTPAISVIPSTGAASLLVIVKTEGTITTGQTKTGEITFTNKSTGQEIKIPVTFIAQNNAYQALITNPPAAGLYDTVIKITGYLQLKQSLAVPATASAIDIRAIVLDTGDVNSDNTINALDLGKVIEDYGSTSPTSDVNNDGTVDALDMGYIIKNYRKKGN
jgi:subtilisin family serine protease